MYFHHRTAREELLLPSEFYLIPQTEWNRSAVERNVFSQSRRTTPKIIHESWNWEKGTERCVRKRNIQCSPMFSLFFPAVLDVFSHSGDTEQIETNIVRLLRLYNRPVRRWLLRLRRDDELFPAYAGHTLCGTACH